MKNNRQNIKELAYQYIVDAIDGETYDRTFSNDLEKFEFVYECFKSQAWYDNNIKIFKGREVDCFADWLQGLPSVINIDFDNSTILAIAVKWGSLPANATERQEDKIIANWFNWIANKFFVFREQAKRKQLKTIKA